MPDLKNHAVQQQAMMEAFFFAYQAFTTKPDEMLARRAWDVCTTACCSSSPAIRASA